jgi:multicomponent Na+:H+ antiporter subunit D
VSGGLLPFLVAVPLLGALAPLLVGGRRPALARRATAAVLLAQVGLVAVVVADVAANGPARLVVGGLPAAVGIGLLVDEVSAVFLAVVAVGGAAVYAVRTDATGTSDALWLLLVGGLTGVCVTADAFNLYVFLEISGLAAYALVATGRGADAALAALQYLLVGTVGATFYLLGVAYAYVATGTLAMADLRVAFAAVGYDSPLVVASFVLVAAGLGVKLALFPLQAWKPDAYARAPPDVAALLATLGSTVAGYALVRLTFGVYTVEFLLATPAVPAGLLVAGVAGVVAGAAFTLRQTNVRRLFAYSSVLQYGLVVVGIAVATPAAVTGALVVLVATAVAKGGLYVAAGSFEREFGAVVVDDYAGGVARAPWRALAVAVAVASLVGLPPSIGFAGKYLLVVGAADAATNAAGDVAAAAAWTAATAILVSTLATLVYAGRVVERLTLAPAGTADPGSGPGAASPRVGGDPATDGGRVDGDAPATPGRPVPSLRTRAAAVAGAAALSTVALGLGSSALIDWLAPVVGGWL